MFNVKHHVAASMARMSTAKVTAAMISNALTFLNVRSRYALMSRCVRIEIRWVD